MRYQFLPWILLTIALVAAPLIADEKPVVAEPGDTVSEKLQGRWAIVSGVSQGRELGKLELAGSYLTVDATEIVTFDGEQNERYRAVFRINASKKPISINLKAVQREVAELGEVVPSVDSPIKLSQGIIEFVGPNKWRLCYALPGGKRPKAFESAKDSKDMLFTLERSGR